MLVVEPNFSDTGGTLAAPLIRIGWPKPGPALLLAALALCSAPAGAHSNGTPTDGCSFCHHGGKTPTVLITPEPEAINPGQTVKLTVSVSAANGNEAGFYLVSSVGKFSILESGTKLSGIGVTHSTPKRSTSAGSPITFAVGWTAPDAPGGVDFQVWANSANGDGTSGGDAEGTAFFSTAMGCTGTKYYHDYDSDGVGAESSGYSVACSPQQFYSTKLGDCNDNDPKIFPGVAEICDGRDNDCNGQIDEGLPITTYCTDTDLDGHGVVGKATVMGCSPSKGFGLCDNDCNDTDDAVYPGAPERCNNKDDNCNARVDEEARLICGVGWCARYGEGCTSVCTPGEPRAEECNDFDDDCDGIADNGSDLALCGGPGLSCRGGYCVVSGSGGMSSFAGSAGASMNDGGSSSATAGSTQSLAGAGAIDPGFGVGASSGCNLAFARPSDAAPLLWLGLGALLRRRRRSAHP